MFAVCVHFLFFLCIQKVCLLLTILAIMTLIIERVALGAVCVALHLASTQAFLPSTSLPTSAWKRVSTRGQTVGNDARGDARSAGRGRRAETAMSGGEHDLYVVGAGYLGWVQGQPWIMRKFALLPAVSGFGTNAPATPRVASLWYCYVVVSCPSRAGMLKNHSSPSSEESCVEPCS